MFINPKWPIWPVDQALGLKQGLYLLKQYYLTKLNLKIMTTKNFSAVPGTLNVETHKTNFLTGTTSAQNFKKRHGLKIACLLFF